MSKHQRVTRAEVEVEGRIYLFAFYPDAIAIHQKWQRERRKIRLIDLISPPKIGVNRASSEFAKGSPAETLHVAACDLAESARLIQQGDLTKATIGDVRAAVKEALRVLKAWEASA